jgi:CRP/FNR family cyclic AMP-dependent transcriptional regulator
VKIAPLKKRLRQHPFARDFSEDQITILATHAQSAQFAPGAYLLREGRAATTFYLLEQGTVALELHGAERGQLFIETITAGECLGWSWLFPPYIWHFSGRAMDAVQTLALDGVALRAQCAADPVLGYALMQRIAGIVMQRLQATRLQLLDVYGDGKRGHL